MSMAASRMIPRTKPIPIGGFIPPATDIIYSHQVGSPENIFEFDESEVWMSSSYQVVSSPKPRKLDFPKKLQPRKANNSVIPGATASSLPVNIPDWSKILNNDYYHNRHLHGQGPGGNIGNQLDGEDPEGEGEDTRIPPHEYLARRRGASFSVHEGVGRTLKGRDLWRVRNAIWKKVGFED